MADEELLSVELVAPERVLVAGTASQVILRTADGDITFLPGHTPLVGAVVPCVVRVVGEDGDELRAAVHGGFVQVGQDDRPDPGEGGVPGRTRVTLLAGVAELVGEIDTERARTALDAATARVAELGNAGRGAPTAAAEAGEAPVEDRELAEAQAALRRAEVRLEAAGVTAGTAPAA